MLDTWDVTLGDQIARVTYGTLFPFARGEDDLDQRLSPGGVTDFIERQFVPIIAETWHTQAEDWGFGNPLHPDWDQDRVIEMIITAVPFALFDGTGTYSILNDVQGKPYSERRIWWISDSNSFADYGSLEHGWRVVFAHEFFHLMQWNVLLHSGHPTYYWQFAFIEGQGLFAPTVQYPELTLHTDHLLLDASRYVREAANGYLARRLNGSYQGLETDRQHRYDAALYWRFLYEQYGDMDIIRAALEEMARYLAGQDPADAVGADIVRSIVPVIDAALARVDGPFHNYEESLMAFSRAIYGLRLENGRCAAVDARDCGGSFFDPQGMYGRPALEMHLQYDGAPRSYQGAIPSSFGVDFLEVGLETWVQGQPLTIRLQGESQAARFSVQLWHLKWGEKSPRAISTRPEVLAQNPDGTFVYTIPSVDTGTYDRLALIITRLDSDETIDPNGDYWVTLEANE
jgi:hypothetical protein